MTERITKLETRDSNHKTTLAEQYIHACSEVDEIAVEIVKGKHLKAAQETCDAIASLTKLLNQIIEVGDLASTPQDIMNMTINSADVRGYYD